MKQSLLLVFLISYGFPQSHVNTRFTMDEISYNLNNLQLDIVNPNHDIHRTFLSIGRMNMGFGNVNILYDEKNNSNHSTFSFSGPDISINNLDFNISFLAENPWMELKQ